jgi:hypothetical protein
MVIVTTKNTTTDRNRIKAINEAERKLEYLRNMDYDSIGAEADAAGKGYLETSMEAPGYDPGVDPLLTDKVELTPGIIATRTVYVLWADDAADKTGTLDTDANTHDYKHVIVEVEWREKGKLHSINLRSFIKGLSSLELGGGEWDETTKKTKAVKSTSSKTGTGKMGMGAKSKVDPTKSGDEP